MVAIAVLCLTSFGFTMKKSKYIPVKTAEALKASYGMNVSFVAYKSEIMMQHMVALPMNDKGEPDFSIGQYYIKLDPKSDTEFAVYNKKPIDFKKGKKIRIYGYAFKISGESKYAGEGTVSEIQVEVHKWEYIK